MSYTNFDQLNYFRFIDEYFSENQFDFDDEGSNLTIFKTETQIYTNDISQREIEKEEQHQRLNLMSHIVTI